MSNDPDQIRSEIEATRSDLSANVNALTDSVRPGSVAKRQADKVTGAVAGLKDKVMGAADGASTDGPRSTSLSDVKDGAAAVPSRAASGTRGNPLAAGIIAFGAGWLLGSLLPASSAEQQAAVSLKDRAAPLTDQVTQAAKEVAGNLKEPAQDAAQQIKETATDAAGSVKDEAQSGASDVKASSQEAVGQVRQQAGS